MAFMRRTVKRNPELIPLLSFVSLGLVESVASMAYGLVIKPDVRINKMNDIPPWEKVKGDQDLKLMNINQKYRVIPELEKLREEIGSYKF